MKCIIRKDLQKEGLGMPIWSDDNDTQVYKTIKGGAKREYRWLFDTSGFQIKHGNKWYNAYSIDFDFL